MPPPLSCFHSLPNRNKAKEMKKEKISVKILFGFFLGVAGCVAITFLLDYFLVSKLRNEGADLVPYGSALGAPIFYSGILGSLVVAMLDFLSRNQHTNAAAMGIIGGGIAGSLNFMVWMSSGYPPFHYSNIIIFMPVVIVSGLVVLAGVMISRIKHAPHNE